MKNAYFLFLLVSTIITAQNTPQVFASTDTFIEGQTDPNLTVHVSTDGDFTSDATASAGKDGSFKITYAATLAAGVTVVYIWTADANGKLSAYVAAPVETAQTILNRIGNPSTNPYKMAAPKGTKITYKATIMNTNFSVPIARFNLTSNSEANKKGDIVLFNSVGAGFGFSAGRLTEVYDDNGEVIANNFQNTVGIHFGALFSAESGDEARNIFAPTVNVSVLDFQIGFGYELGTISANQKRTFFTLSYAIPLYKLTNTGFWVWRSGKEVGDDPKFSKTF